MGEIEDKLEKAKEVITYSKRVIDWASLNMYRRMGFTLFIMLLLLGGWYLYVMALFDHVDNDHKVNSKLESRLAKINNVLINVEYLELCQSTRFEANERLRDWYCERAFDGYLSFLTPLETVKAGKYRDIGAYGAMEVHLRSKIRELENAEVTTPIVSKEKKHLKILTHWVSMLAFILFVFSIYCFIVYYFYKKKANQMDSV